MIKPIQYATLALMAAFIVSGCVTTNKYMFNNVSYSNKEDAVRAEQAYHMNLSTMVKPLSSPLVEKTLLFSMPTKEQIFSDIVLRETKKGRDTTSVAARDRIDYISQTIYDAYKYEYVTIKNNKIYKSVELSEGSYSIIPQPTDTIDVLCFYSTGDGIPVVYLINTKNGKQVLAFDVSLPDGRQRVESMLNSIKAFALQ